MDETIKSIYSGREVSPSELRPFLEKLNLEISADSVDGFYGSLKNELMKMFRIPLTLSILELQLILVYTYTNIKNDTIERIMGQIEGAEEDRCSNKGEGAVDQIEDEWFSVNNGDQKITIERAWMRKEIESLKAQNKSLVEINSRLEKEKKDLEEEIKRISKELLDKEYESGFFIDDEVFKKIEQENVELKRTNEKFYDRILKAWYKLVKEKIVTKNEDMNNPAKTNK